MWQWTSLSKQAHFMLIAAKNTVGTQTYTKVLDFSPCCKRIKIPFHGEDSNLIAGKSNLIKQAGITAVQDSRSTFRPS